MALRTLSVFIIIPPPAEIALANVISSTAPVPEELLANTFPVPMSASSATAIPPALILT